MNSLPCGRRTLLVLIAGLAVSAARAENWPQWRGPDNTGVSKETKLPTEWTAASNIAWKLDLPGSSGATPAVWGDRIFLTSEDDKDVLLICVSTSGKELWRHKYATGSRHYRQDEGNGASPSPSTDGKHVWVFSGTGDLACFSVDGEEVWHVNVQDRYGAFKMQWGMHTSPLLYGDRLYLALLHSGGHYVIALDKANGKEVWKVTRESDAEAECEQSYASPSIGHNGKEAYLVVHGNDYATAHRLQDGNEIWRVGGLNPREHYVRSLRFVASPVVTPDLIVVPSAKRGPVVAVKPDIHGNVEPGSAQEAWRLSKNTPDVPSPLVYGNYVYLCGESGTLTCLDAKTGKEQYSKPLHRAKYRASPVAADGNIYLTARDGVVTVVKAGSSYEQVAENRLPDQTAASPVISNGRIYMRGYSAVWAIGKAKE